MVKTLMAAVLLCLTCSNKPTQNTAIDREFFIGEWTSDTLLQKKVYLSITDSTGRYWNVRITDNIIEIQKRGWIKMFTADTLRSENLAWANTNLNFYSWTPYDTAISALRAGGNEHPWTLPYIIAGTNPPELWMADSIDNMSLSSAAKMQHWYKLQKK